MRLDATGNAAELMRVWGDLRSQQRSPSSSMLTSSYVVALSSAKRTSVPLMNSTDLIATCDSQALFVGLD